MPHGTDVPLNGRYRKTHLDNGLRVVTESVSYVRSISLGVWIQVGSRDEPEHECGISHFLEHMLFKGTARRNAFQIAGSLESLGGSLDAFTSRDVTCFFVRCLDEYIGVAVDVLSDMLLHPLLDPGEMEKEKRVVLEEIQAVEDTPDDLIHDLFAHSVWGPHPVGAPILGYPEKVQGLTREQLGAHMARHYHPERVVISAAGNLDHEALVELVQEWFAFPPGKPPAPFQRVSPRDTAHSRRHYRRDIGQTHICLGGAACAYTHPRKFDHLVMNTALGEGMSSLLFQNIRERLGLAYSVFSYLEMLEDTGLFGTYMACDSNRVEQAVDMACRELKRLRKEGLTPSELASAKAQLKSDLIMGQESLDKRMSRLAHQELYTGRYLPVEETLSGIDRVDLHTVHETCREMLNVDQMHRVTLGP